MGGSTFTCGTRRHVNGSRLPATLLALLLVTGCGPTAEDSVRGTVPDLYGANIGTVNFPVSCNADAAESVQRGLVLLHHMMYDQARLLFAMAANIDADCAMAMWGQAMTLVHPLWPDQPSAAELELGRRLLASARSQQRVSARERAYLDAADAYFVAEAGDTETMRLARFETAWGRAAGQFPEDLEARALYALAMTAAADPTDKHYTKQRRAGELARSILEVEPDHSGGHHYFIHAYDNPVLAPEALAVADRYGMLAPVVPHATHMMTHIYTRLGQWQKSVTWNLKSADSAWAICTETGEVVSHYQHALDYLAYAYLQMGADDRASEVVARVASLAPPFGSLNPDAAAYAFAALPARYALERHDWQAAADLQPSVPKDFPWQPRHDGYVAITHYARALGSAHLGAIEDAKAEIAALARLRDGIAPRSAYWAGQVEIQRLAASAWTAHATADDERAIALMEQAANLEASTEKSPVSPGEVAPAVELLGDLWMTLGKADAALAAYEQSLARSPRRLNSLVGALRAAEALGATVAARAYRDTIAEQLDPASPRGGLLAAALTIPPSSGS